MALVQAARVVRSWRAMSTIWLILSIDCPHFGKSCSRGAIVLLDSGGLIHEAPLPVDKKLHRARPETFIFPARAIFELTSPRFQLAPEADSRRA
jgi:hypothetical protein